MAGGDVVAVVDPSPSSPLPFDPQHRTPPPDDITTQVCVYPAAILDTPVRMSDVGGENKLAAAPLPS